MKRKNKVSKVLRRLISCMTAVFLLVGLCSTASAAVSKTASWTSTVCKSYFQTSDYISKSYHATGTWWEEFYVRATKVTHTPSKSPATVNVRPTKKDGTAMGATKRLTKSTAYARITSANQTPTTSSLNVYLKVSNPYSSSGTNMASAGNWYGYSWAA